MNQLPYSDDVRTDGIIFDDFDTDLTDKETIAIDVWHHHHHVLQTSRCALYVRGLWIVWTWRMMGTIMNY